MGPACRWGGAISLEGGATAPKLDRSGGCREGNGDGTGTWGGVEADGGGVGLKPGAGARSLAPLRKETAALAQEEKQPHSPRSSGLWMGAGLEGIRET